jgi:allophanate hydrolase subunit 2
VALGAIQVPGDGQPLVLMADRQPTGGYPKIGTVIRADLPLLAQRRPGQTVRFAPVDPEEAVAALRRAHPDEASLRARSRVVRRLPGLGPHPGA